jgi:ABC-type transport system substrate-binding protein
LLGFSVGGADVVPGLAEKYEVNADLTEWTFTLRQGVTFHDGATLDANDVVATYASIWDAKNPAHKGRTTTFEYFTTYFGAFLNAE